MIGIKEIWIEAENCETVHWTPIDDNTDVVVTFEDGRKHIATFFTYKNIQTLIDKNKRTGECLNGKYFWASDMILVDECSRNNIEKLIFHLIEEEEFHVIFKEITAESNV